MVVDAVLQAAHRGGGAGAAVDLGAVGRAFRVAVDFLDDLGDAVT